MKRFYAFVFAVLSLTSAGAQCVPDPSLIVPGYYPDSLPHAVVGAPYTSDIQVLSPTSYTVPPGITFIIDSIHVDSIGGLPPGFGYSCTPSMCTLLPMINGCLQITGPALPASAAGTVYPLTIYLRAYVHLSFPPIALDTPQVVTTYYIAVDQAAGVTSLSKTRFDASEVQPNPVTDRSILSYAVPNGGTVSIRVFNLLGSEISNRSEAAHAGTNTVSFYARNYSPGIYFVSLSDGKTTLTRRMVIKNP